MLGSPVAAVINYCRGVAPENYILIEIGFAPVLFSLGFVAWALIGLSQSRGEL